MMRRHRLSEVIAIAGIALAASAAGVVRALPGDVGDRHEGKELFERRCAGCHALDNERTGPRLRGVFGRPAGSVPSFPYSEALRKSGVVWDRSSLDKWLTDPDGFIPDNDMAFRVVSPDERAAIIAYLKGLSGR